MYFWLFLIMRDLFIYGHSVLRQASAGINFEKEMFTVGFGNLNILNYLGN